MVNISLSSAWSNIINILIGPDAQSTWNGQDNSTAIMGQSGHTSSAAKLCDDYTNTNYGTGVYSDWYLPAIDQLNLIYHARYVLNKNFEGVSGADKLTTGSYWSSTENSTNAGCYYGFFNGIASSTGKSVTGGVRAVRAF